MPVRACCATFCWYAALFGDMVFVPFCLGFHFCIHETGQNPIPSFKFLRHLQTFFIALPL